VGGGSVPLNCPQFQNLLGGHSLTWRERGAESKVTILLFFND